MINYFIMDYNKLLKQERYSYINPKRNKLIMALCIFNCLHSNNYI